MEPGLYRSTDGGATWQSITGELSDRGDIDNIVIDPAPGGGLYAATGQGLFKWVTGGSK
jgi:hypothetical protein